MLALEDLAESAFAHDPEQFEVLERGVFLVLLLEDHLRRQVSDALGHFLLFVGVVFFRITLVVLGGLVLFVSKSLALVVVQVLGLGVVLVILFRQNVVTREPKVAGWEARVSSLHVVFSGGEAFQVLLVVDVKDLQILLLDLGVPLLQQTNNNISPSLRYIRAQEFNLLFRVEAVVVVFRKVNGELVLLFALGQLGHAAKVRDVHFSLHCRLVHIIYFVLRDH